MPAELQQLEIAIATLDAQRALLGDAVVDAALGPMRARRGALQAKALAEPTPTLKQVSILFVDVVGSTTLSQHLDPEEISAVMDGALMRGTAVVQAHGGQVLQYAGDSMLAVFGAGTAQEDDPERAVRCGLALLALGRLLGTEVQAAHSYAGFNLRVGIHTGGVLLGGGVDEVGSIRGMGVNIAARMEQTAPAGALRISHGTYRHVRGVFDVEQQPPLVLKGVVEPVVTYLVQRAKPRAFKVLTRGIEGVETRMVGRSAELETLQAAFLRLVQPGAGLQRLAVVADAGVGKSRLLYEFENWAEARGEDFYLFQGRATPQTQMQPYGLLRDMLAWRLQIHDSDSMDTAKRRLEDGVVPLFVADEGPTEAQAHAHLMGQLIGLDYAASPHIRGIQHDGRQIRNRGFHAVAQWLRRLSTAGGAQDAQGRAVPWPIMMLLDDLHWADDASLDFLDYLAQVDHDVPLLMLALARPALFERRQQTHRDGERHITLQLLDRGLSRELANELLKKLPAVPAALRELITGGAEGNPFYMEELVKMLIDQGVIVTTPGRWALVSDKLLTIQLPPTLTGVLQARLDGLPATERAALQLASVLGQHFWDQALAYVAPHAAQQLPALAQRALVHARDSLEDGARQYAFQHQILHQVTYGTVLKGQRQQAHAKAAQWFAQSTGARARDFVGAAAEHFAQAGDLANACEYFTRAAEQAAAGFAHDVALGYTERALALAGPTEHALRWRLLANRERTLDLLGRRTAQRADIDALGTLAEALDDDRLRAEAAWRRCDIAMRTSDHRTQLAEAQRAQALAERAGAPELALMAQQRVASALAFGGEPAAGRALAQPGLARAQALGLMRVQLFFLNALGICARQLGDLAATLDYDLQSLAMSRQIGDRRLAALFTGNVGAGYLNFGAHALALSHLEEALRLNRALGNREFEGHNLGALSVLALQQGDDALALARAQASLDISVEVASRRNECKALADLGNAELALGHWAAATAAFERMQALARTIKDTAYGLDALESLARLALACGDSGLAARCIDALLHQDQAEPAPPIGPRRPFEGTDAHRLRLTIHQVWARAADPRAGAALADAQALLMADAAAISDLALRSSFLANIPEHREIVALVAAGAELGLVKAGV